MRLPRTVLLFVSASLVALAYALILFTNFGNAFYGGTYLGAVTTDAIAVLAVFSCLEVVRTERAVALRAVAGALGTPLLLALLLTLWYAVRRLIAA